MAIPVLTHAHLFLGFLLADPIYRFAGLGSIVPGPLPGGSTIDPNFGFIDQALTHRAATDLLAGRLPWWNPFETFGSPLAGEMQCSALFPFSLLVLLPNGLLFEGVLLQIVAGIGMIVLCRRLGISAWAALVAAVTYESCGTFAWLSGAWTYSIPWLPWMILGLELAHDSNLRVARSAPLVIAAALAFLLYAGFIETSYFEGLFGVLWLIIRAPSVARSGRRRYFIRVVGGGLVAFALSAPIVVAFADTIAMGFVGLHDGGNGHPSLVPWAEIQKLAPYAYGPIFASRQSDLAPVWGATGGFLGFGLAAIALAGVFGKSGFPQRIGCACFVVCGYAAIFGGPLQPIVLAIPGVKYTAYYRYLDPAIGFACSLLAARAIDDLERGVSRLKPVFALAAMLLLASYAFSRAVPQLFGPGSAIDANLGAWHEFSLVVLALVTGAIGASIAAQRPRMRAAMLSMTICAESVVFVFIPTLSNPSSATLALGDIAYLQTHLGLQRFYSFGPISPNYGSLFGIADIDYNDLPIPKLAVERIVRALDPGASPGTFLPMGRPGRSRENVFSRNIAAYEASGVSYVVTGSDAPAPAANLVAVYRDAVTTIWKMPSFAPYFAASCALRVASRTMLSTECSRPATLCRLELNVPGWAAFVEGNQTTIRPCGGGTFQAIELPAGKSRIDFAYAPPGETQAIVVFWIGVCAFVTLAVRRMRTPYEIVRA